MQAWGGRDCGWVLGSFVSFLSREGFICGVELLPISLRGFRSGVPALGCTLGFPWGMCSAGARAPAQAGGGEVHLGGPTQTSVSVLPDFRRGS